MDGRKPLLRHLFIAALACSSHVVTHGDEFIRPPARTPTPTSSGSPTGAPKPATQSIILQPSSNSAVATSNSPAVTEPTPVQAPAASRQIPSLAPAATPGGMAAQGLMAPQGTLAPQATLAAHGTLAAPAPANVPAAPRAHASQNPLGVGPTVHSAMPQSPTRATRGPTTLAPPLNATSQTVSTPTTSRATAAHTRTGVPATALNWQPRGGRGSNMHMSGYTQPSTGHAADSSEHAELTLSAARPNSVFVEPQSADLAAEDLPQVPPEALEASDNMQGMRLLVQPSALEAIQAEELRSRREMAARISEELSAGTNNLNSIPTGSIEPGLGWQAVGEELKQHLASCEQMLSRKAYLSAMEESNLAILQLVRSLDLRQNQMVSEPAWSKAQQALREAQEFTSVQRIANDTELFSRLIQSHETPTLRGANVRDLTPLAAAQHYRAYAERCLIEASQGHPWFSELYYCKGRALQAQAESGHQQADSMLQHALTYYRAANAIQPNNATNANQLGYVLLRMDRPTEALAQLSQTVQLPNCPLEAWQNIAQASTRLGDDRTQQWALQNYLNLKSQGAQPAGPVNTLVELDPRQFAAMSPPSIGPHTPVMMQAAPPASYPQNSATLPPPTGLQPGNTSAPNRTANTPRFGIFR